MANPKIMSPPGLDGFGPLGQMELFSDYGQSPEREVFSAEDYLDSQNHGISLTLFILVLVRGKQPKQMIPIDHEKFIQRVSQKNQ